MEINTVEFLHSFRIQYSSHFFREENALLFVENRFVFSHHSHLDKNKFPFKFLSIDSIRNWELIIIKKFDSIFVYFFFKNELMRNIKIPHRIMQRLLSVLTSIMINEYSMNISKRVDDNTSFCPLFRKLI